MSNPELTNAALASLKSAKELADTVAHFFPEEGIPIQEDLIAFATKAEEEIASNQVDATTPPSAEIRLLSEFLHQTGSSRLRSYNPGHRAGLRPTLESIDTSSLALHKALP